MSEKLLRCSWKPLNKQQVGAYAEYFVKMELTMYGFQVYSSEVDDQGIDFVARYQNGPFITIQVKSCRRLGGYVFMKKSKFRLNENLYLALALLFEGKQPQLFLVPSIVWKNPNAIFKSRNYRKVGQKSKPEYGLNLSKKNMSKLNEHSFENAMQRLITKTC